jgi:peptidoglycan/LPS O-acetylase OafA/YrhL
MGIIRILLAVSVVISHSTPLFGLELVPGNIAVELFFIISGFYMALVLSEKYTLEKDKLFWLNFYKSRFLRLYPVFVALSVCGWIYFGLLALYFGKVPANGFVEIYERMPWWGDAFAIFSNLTMIGQDIPSLFHISPDGIMHFFYSRTAGTTEDGAIWVGQVRSIGQAWSIGTEIWFYLLAPFLVRRSNVIIAAIAIISLGLKIFMEVHLNYLTYFFFPAQLVFFLIGVLAYKIGKLHSFIHLKTSGFIGLSLFSLSLTVYQLVNSQYYQIYLFILLGLFIYPIFCLTAHSQTDRFIGELSYPIYMVHMLIISVTNPIFHKLLGLKVAPSWIFLTLSIIASVLIYFYIEKPFNQYRKRFATPEKAITENK